ncbi:MAG: nuclear transport factor 2 family protein [Candidatus Thiodiazotropha endolucinida]|nr:nuclear transport factor 2 family protein [Candidatus Thiodiazotropha endolucinida]
MISINEYHSSIPHLQTDQLSAGVEVLSDRHHTGKTMSNPYTTPQDAEDAYYDAIEEKDLQAFMQVWEESEEVLCLLPMITAQRGKDAIRKLWEPLMQSDVDLDIQTKHLAWIETPELAIHLIEELVKSPGQDEPQPVYATNIFRKTGEGWRLLMHQNSPTPPPPGLHVPGMEM